MQSSQWEVFLRCLKILVLLQHEPQSREELSEALYPDAGSEAAIKRLENDLMRLRTQLGIDVGYDLESRLYKIYGFGDFSFFDLPNPALEALIFLANTFEPGTPHYHNIQSLLETLRALLPPHQRKRLEKPPTLTLKIQQLDSDEISASLWQKLETAYLEYRLIEFAYTSPQQADQEPRTHVVEPRKLYFDSTHRHYYLYGYCRYSVGPFGQIEQRNYFRYRIGRIIENSLTILPDRFPLHPPRPKTYEVIYQLAPHIARMGISRHFEEMHEDFQPDGGVIVSARTDDLFFATRTLLHYGAGCQVLGGKELLKDFRKTVLEMAAIYQEISNQ